MYLIFTAGVVLWLTYGLMIQSWPIIVGNIVHAGAREQRAGDEAQIRLISKQA